MFRFTRTVVLVAVAFLVSLSALAQGPSVTASSSIGLVVDADAPTLHMAASIHQMELRSEPDLGRILLGTTAGAAAGAAVGLGLSYLIIQATGGPGDAVMFFPLRVAVYAVPAVPVGMYLGARWGSDRTGNPWLTAGAAILGTAAGIGVGILVGDALARGTGGGASAEIVGALVGISVGVVIPALVEWRTAQ
jgi:hypothetical protein